ncbi:MAG: VTT domain-containing protein [Treponema sp.]|jgi:uncharacterized membrane protein YdjX (TVP38/TMEM64 family)|nr:VTT domain-containing protein [Treponema sp.]
MKKPVRAGIVFFAAFFIASAAVCVLLRPFIVNVRLSEYREQFSAWLAGIGFKGMAILLGIQILQILVAVIPGGPVEIVAGAAYGAWGGFAICILGCLIAGAGIFLAVRTFGVPLVERFFGKELTGKYRFLGNAKKVSLALFLLYLIPGVPKDALTYIAPLGPIKPGRFLLISTIARSPAILMSAMLGSSALRGNWTLIVALFAATAVTGIVGLMCGERIVDKIKHKHYW